MALMAPEVALKGAPSEWMKKPDLADSPMHVDAYEPTKNGAEMAG